MKKDVKKKPGFVDTFKDKQKKSAQRKTLEELFNDWYIRREEVYKMNFVRGIVFGLGSALGGTVGLAIVLGILALALNLLGGFPVIGDWFEGIDEEISVSSSIQ